MVFTFKTDILPMKDKKQVQKFSIKTTYQTKFLLF